MRGKEHGLDLSPPDGTVLLSLLLAFRRYRRVPRRDPEILARRRGGNRATGRCRGWLPRWASTAEIR
jgi:hypothetical protein